MTLSLPYVAATMDARIKNSGRHVACACGMLYMSDDYASLRRHMLRQAWRRNAHRAGVSTAGPHGSPPERCPHEPRRPR
jgi:hypothetical protein